MIADPVKSYGRMVVTIAVAVAGALLGALLFMGGRAVGAGQAARTIAAKDKALLAASASLAAAAGVLRAVDRESKRRLDEQRQAEQRAHAAGEVAEQARRTLDARTREFARDLERARRDAACDALLQRDLRKECGL